MRIATITALISVTLGSAFFAACSSSSGGGGNTGGNTTVGGSGGVGTGGAPVGGAGGSSGGSGATTSGGAGGGTSAGSCKGQCGSADPQGTAQCYCDSACEGNKDCCADYATECPSVPNLPLPAGCVNANFKTPCNPVTNEGCTGAESCDYVSGGVKCYPDGNTEPADAPCDTKNNKFCVPKYHCDGASEAQPIGVCKHFCCADTDCAAGVKCVAASANIGTLGVCGGTVTPTDGGTDGGGTGGSTGDSGTDAATD
ncbi:MAG: hypothetical protein IPI67_22215 [Myxococcales bacterium]|nr:hypothetical protein [Myxococcales bacterium]